MLTLGFGNSRVRRALGSMGWATTDQVLSTLSNLIITVAVARAMGAEGLGQFTVAFAAYLVVLGFSRSLIAQPLLVQPRDERDREAEESSTTLTLLFALAGGFVVALVGLGLGRLALLVVAVAMPVTLCQDVLRYQAFRRKKVHLATVADGCWVVGSLIAWPVVTASASPSVALACWAGAALLGTVAGWLAVRPGFARPRTAVAWWRRDTGGLSIPLALDSALSTVSTQGLVFILAWLLGDAALGVFRAGQVYFGPLGMVFTAFGMFAMPYLAQRSTAPTAGLAARLSAVTAGLAVVACTAIVFAEPLLHTLLYAGSIDVPLILMIPIAARVVLNAGGSGLSLVSKVRRRAGDIAWSRLGSTVLGLVLVIVATEAYGLQGAAWAVVAQAAMYTIGLGIRVARSRTTGAAVRSAGMVSEHG